MGYSGNACSWFQRIYAPSKVILFFQCKISEDIKIVWNSLLSCPSVNECSLFLQMKQEPALPLGSFCCIFTFKGLMGTDGHCGRIPTWRCEYNTRIFFWFCIILLLSFTWWKGDTNAPTWERHNLCLFLLVPHRWSPFFSVSHYTWMSWLYYLNFSYLIINIGYVKFTDLGTPFNFNGLVGLCSMLIMEFPCFILDANFRFLCLILNSFQEYYPFHRGFFPLLWIS